MVGRPGVTGRADRLLSALIAVLLAGVALAALGGLIAVADRGLDITDEGYFIQSILRPGDIVVSPVDFGPVFSALGDDIVTVRRLSFVLMAGAGALLGMAALRLAAPGGAGLAAGAAAGGIGGLAGIAQWWLLTPSYNTLAGTGAMIMAAGVTLYAGGGRFARPRGALAAAVMVGAGVVLAFLGRPNAAAALAVVTVPFALILAGPVRALALAGVAAASALALLVLNAVLTDGGPVAYVARLSQAAELALRMQGGHDTGAAFAAMRGGWDTLLTRLGWPPVRPLAPVLFGTLALAAGVAWLRPAWRAGAAALVSAVLAGGTLWALWTWQVEYPGYWAPLLGEVGLELAVLMAGLALAGLAIWPAGQGATARGPRIRQAVVAAYLLAMGVFLPYGTGIDWTYAIGAGSLFLTLAAVLLAGVAAPGAPRAGLLATLALLAAVPPGMAVRESLAAPYRLAGGLGTQTEPLVFLGNPTTLRVDAVTARWAADLQEAALGAGWTPGMALVDLTGGTPAAAAVLGAEAPGIPWLVGGYSGSDDFVATGLGYAAPDTLARAWVLTAPGGARALPATVLSAHGPSFPEGYERVTEVVTGWRSEVQELWRPAAR